MPRFFHAMFLLLTTLLPLPAWAASHGAAFVLPHGARVQVAALVDGYTVGLHVDGLEARALERALLRLHAEKVEVLASRGRKSLAYVRFAERVVAADARLGKSTQRRSTQVHLQITTESPRDVVLAHVMDQPLPIPKTLETDVLAQADDAFVHRRLGEAELLLKRIQDSGMQRAWVMLRQGDLAVFHGRVEQACSAYNEAQVDGDMRTASTLAALRARVLGCSKPKLQHKALAQAEASLGAPTSENIDWALLLRRSGRDDPIGRHMAQEARWALSYEREPQTLLFITGLQGPIYQQQLDAPLRASLLARMLRRTEPFALATVWTHGDPLKGHPEAFDLSLVFGLAWCALDAPSGWQPPKLGSKSWMNLRPNDRARLVQEVSACSLLEAQEQGPQPVVYTAATTKPGLHLAALKRRLALAQQALQNLPSAPQPLTEN